MTFKLLDNMHNECQLTTILSRNYPITIIKKEKNPYYFIYKSSKIY